MQEKRSDEMNMAWNTPVPVARLVWAIDFAARYSAPAFRGANKTPLQRLVDTAADQYITQCTAEIARLSVGRWGV